MWAVCDVSVVQPHLYFGLFGWGHATLKIVPKYAHLNLSCSKRGGAKGVSMHKHVMWAVCDVSVVQPYLYFGLFGWGHATLKIVPKNAHLNLSCSKRGGAKGVSHAQACHVGCV